MSGGVQAVSTGFYPATGWSSHCTATPASSAPELDERSRYSLRWDRAAANSPEQASHPSPAGRRRVAIAKAGEERRCPGVEERRCVGVLVSRQAVAMASAGAPGTRSLNELIGAVERAPLAPVHLRHPAVRPDLYPMSPRRVLLVVDLLH